MSGTGKTRNVSILGSTGSIGTQTLEVVSLHEDRLKVVALTANENVDLLEEQVRRYRPVMAGMVSEAAAGELKRRLAGINMEVLGGKDCLLEASVHPEADTVLNAVVGSAGLPPSIAALESGKRLALANKESMVAGGDLVLAALARGGELIPVDSEHGAIFHCLRGEEPRYVERIILTASGGPFYGRSRAELVIVTRAEALSHPTWKMGRKITIDSATLMNKGLEVIEAHFLFGLPYEQISVVAHPQSVVHSLVEFVDGSLSAQLSVPDMRLPIALALSYPERWGPALKKTSLPELGRLDFGDVDRETFRCLDLAYNAGEKGGTATAVLNAANEIAVSAFLEGKIGFMDIEGIIEETLEGHEPRAVTSLEDVIRAEEWARERAAACVEKAG
ncbi:MAG: 1-deoxy-D-xylulose-5-phosphate reductoisomerase [Candidatus Solincola sediminis]|uniref:1-deoxy-D-xylulose 5-phosphate reductoisomerase n=1 Tax=Candidatus Solincola sediminis TaxID=1797199 RepID=A0A1F2WFR4_9ACTN|nr:MAG: 1-deoxy-D-xylulose-5-phosphate reductoisomerase [Candidatus Solincola sediminis]OFW59977.1 MAG: 1-deoxy-D-xylulose-5-phosphate reductoisomerase [Candidatus Solincola sediminis]